MPLLSLPLELQQHVFRFLGSGWFQSDASRLTISKSWYRVARPVFNAQLRFTDRNLTAFSNAVESGSGSIDTLRAEVQAVELEIEEFADWNKGLSKTNFGNQSTARTLRDAGWGARWGFWAKTHWAVALEKGISALAMFLRTCRALQTVRITAAGKYETWLLNVPRRGILGADTLAQMMDLKSITRLDLDSFSLSHVNSDMSDEDLKRADSHSCRTVSRLLPQLRYLRLRTFFMCPAMLELSDGHPETFLKEVEIYTSIYLKDGEDEITVFARPCDAGDELEPFSKTRERIREQFEALAAKSPALRVARIKWDVFPVGVMQSLDVLTGESTHRQGDTLVDKVSQIRAYYSFDHDS